MGNCKNCNDKCAWNILMPCRVCELNNGDALPKKVCWCTFCSAYICKAHWNDYFERGLAAIKSLFVKNPTPKAVESMKELEVVSESPSAPDPYTTPEPSTEKAIDSQSISENIPTPAPEPEDWMGKKHKRKKFFD